MQFKNSMELDREKINGALCCFLVLMMPFSWVSISIGSVYRIVVLFSFFVFMLCNKFTIYIHGAQKKLFYTWTIYVLYTGATFLWAQSASYGLNNLYGMVLLYIMSIIFLDTSYNNSTRKAIEVCWLIATVFLVVLFVFGETIQLGVGERRSLVILGTPTDANEYASFFIIGFNIGLNMLLKLKRKVQKLLILSVLLSVIYVMLMVASRGALLAVFISALITVAMNFKNVPFWKVFLVGVGITLIIVLFAMFLLPLIPQTNLNRITLNALKEDSGSGRWLIWLSAMDKFINGDIWRILLGYGYGRFDVVTQYGGTELVLHNQFLQQLISYGILGLVLYVLLISQCWKKLKNEMRDYYSIFIGIMVMSLTLTMGSSYKILWIILFITMMKQNKEITNDHTITNYKGEG